LISSTISEKDRFTAFCYLFMRVKSPLVAVSVLLTTLYSAQSLQADEGMWLFNAPPTKLLQTKYQFTPSQAWLDRLQKSSVRFNSGASGSFVSADGLVITNHHVGADAVQKFGDATRNYIKEGFYAGNSAGEKRCYDLELNVLMSIEDVTSRVNSKIPPEMTPADAYRARRQVIAEIEKESFEKTGLRSNVVTLYQGGSYQLYRYKQYTDVRLVFAPEAQIAFYGGDPDNFEYPRYDLDICLFRVYENNKPVHLDNYLRFNLEGPKAHDLIFVAGHPIRTEREKTVAQLTYERDHGVPDILYSLYQQEVNLLAYASRTIENARRSRDDLFGVQNNRKRSIGQQAGLLDPELFGKLVNRENEMRSAFDKSAEFQPAIQAYSQIADAQAILKDNELPFNLLEGPRKRPLAFDSDLFKIARELVRSAAERQKPDGQRLPEYQDTGRSSFELQLLSEAPIYDDLEIVKLTSSLNYLASQLGADNPIVQQILAGKSPRERANTLIRGTKLKDVAFRKQLYTEGMPAIRGSTDPLIALAEGVDDAARAARLIDDQQLEVQHQAHSVISKAQFALAKETAPDATFTLRLSYGTVEGYEEDGHAVPALTNFAGLYQRAAEHENKPPFDLPDRWVKNKGKLDLTASYNFVSTDDIVGGSSGSPVVNRAGEFVGIIFDGNIQSLILNYIYTDKQARAVSVDSKAIIEALSKVYVAAPLVQELTNGKRN
jgi:hypothetical protein